MQRSRRLPPPGMLRRAALAPPMQSRFLGGSTPGCPREGAGPPRIPTRRCALRAAGAARGCSEPAFRSPRFGARLLGRTQGAGRAGPGRVAAAAAAALGLGLWWPRRRWERRQRSERASGPGPTQESGLPRGRRSARGCNRAGAPESPSRSRSGAPEGRRSPDLLLGDGTGTSDDSERGFQDSPPSSHPHHAFTCRLGGSRRKDSD